MKTPSNSCLLQSYKDLHAETATALRRANRELTELRNAVFCAVLTPEIIKFLRSNDPMVLKELVRGLPLALAPEGTDAGVLRALVQDTLYNEKQAIDARYDAPRMTEEQAKSHIGDTVRMNGENFLITTTGVFGCTVHFGLQQQTGANAFQAGWVPVSAVTL